MLKPWPISELEEHPDLCIVQYFKYVQLQIEKSQEYDKDYTIYSCLYAHNLDRPNAVVTIDSRKCEWIYVIMSVSSRIHTFSGCLFLFFHQVFVVLCSNSKHCF